MYQNLKRTSTIDTVTEKQKYQYEQAKKCVQFTGLVDAVSKAMEAEVAATYK